MCLSGAWDCQSSRSKCSPARTHEAPLRELSEPGAGPSWNLLAGSEVCFQLTGSCVSRALGAAFPPENSFRALRSFPGEAGASMSRVDLGFLGGSSPAFTGTWSPWGRQVRLLQDQAGSKLSVPSDPLGCEEQGGPELRLCLPITEKVGRI